MEVVISCHYLPCVVCPVRNFWIQLAAALTSLRLAISICLLVMTLSLLAWLFTKRGHSVTSSVSTVPAISGSSTAVGQTSTSADRGPTKVYAHNLMLRRGPDFRVYVRWLRGQLVRTRPDDDPSFDDPESFNLVITNGVLRANIGDIAHFLNSSGVPNSPLKNITLSGDGDQINLHGTLHKFIPLPIELVGTISVASNNQIQVHVTKLNVLKIPMKGLLGGFHVTLSDLFNPQGIPGIQVTGDDIVFDTVKLLPPPHIRGQLTSVRVINPDLEEIYGDAQDVVHVEQWRNFLRLSGGTLDFGKLTMHHVDLIMIDISDDAWFDLDLLHYQDQLVNGYTRMTPQAGMQIFMPDLDDLKTNKAIQEISIEWMKNRNISPPPDVTPK